MTRFSTIDNHVVQEIQKLERRTSNLIIYGVDELVVASCVDRPAKYNGRECFVLPVGRILL